MGLATKKGRNRILFSMLIVLIWGGIAMLISTAITTIVVLVTGIITGLATVKICSKRR